MDIISESIVNLLKTAKRLVVPSLGAFIRKDGEERVVFVEFLKKDDGVLADYLTGNYGLSSQEVEEAVAGFAADLRAKATREEGFVIGGLGAIRLNANGIYDLDYDPSADAKPSRPAPQPVAETPKPLVVEVPRPAVTQSVPVPEAAHFPAPPKPAVAPEELKARPKENPISRSYTPAKEPVLQYQKPVKGNPDHRKKRADLIMITAIAAAAVAIGAMIYGVLNEKNNELQMPEETEQVQVVATDQAE